MYHYVLVEGMTMSSSLKLNAPVLLLCGITTNSCVLGRFCFIKVFCCGSDYQSG